jgi:triosephosphate isomerase (TIM)
MRKKIVAGNWKMNCDREEALSLATEITGMVTDEINFPVRIILAPPFVHIGAVAKLTEKSSVLIAAQNCSSEVSGAYTGEISAKMLASVGATGVILGHSERRQLFGESPAIIKNKIDRSLAEKLDVIFCCGETLEQREAGTHYEVIAGQLEQSLFHLSAGALTSVIIAYEPVWAIGTGKTATPSQAQEMHAYIRKLVSEKYGNSVADGISVLYGGSCNESNAKELFALPDVDGGLIGGASLKSRSFVNIIRSLPQ